MWLASAPSKHALGLALVGICVLAVGASREPAKSACPFEQTWYAGDVHFNERIEFRADATGTWISSGMADEARRERRDFQWSRTESALTVTHDDQVGVVRYKVELYKSRHCFLTFANHPLLADESGFHHFSDSE